MVPFYNTLHDTYTAALKPGQSVAVLYKLKDISNSKALFTMYCLQLLQWLFGYKV